MSKVVEICKYSLPLSFCMSKDTFGPAKRLIVSVIDFALIVLSSLSFIVITLNAFWFGSDAISNLSIWSWIFSFNPEKYSKLSLLIPFIALTVRLVNVAYSP